jgi:hypothetical protein
MNAKRCTLFVVIMLALAWPASLSISGQPVVKQRATLSMGSTVQVQSPAQKNFMVQQSIGQSSVINSYQSNGYLLLQGFVQPSQIAESKEKTAVLQSHISPNPFQHHIQIVFDALPSTKIALSISNLVGQKLKAGIYPPSKTIDLDVETLPPGVYILKMNADGKQLTSKIIKNKP